MWRIGSALLLMLAVFSLGVLTRAAAAGVPVAAAAPADGQQGAAAPIIGQTFTFLSASDDAVLQGTVLDFQDKVRFTYPNGKRIAPREQYVAVFIRVTNPTPSVQRVGPYSLSLADSKGRTFVMPKKLDVQFLARDLYSMHILYTDIPAGGSDDEVFVFDVESSSHDFRMVGAER